MRIPGYRLGVQAQYFSFAFSLVMVAAAFGAHADANISFSPSTVNLEIGQRAFVSISVDGVAQPGLAGFQFTASFNSTPVNLQNPNANTPFNAFMPLGGNSFCAFVTNRNACNDPAWFLTSTGRTVPSGFNSIDNALGRLVLSYGTSGQNAPPMGAGALALIEVVAVQRGSSVISLNDVILATNENPPRPLALGVLGTLTVNVGGAANAAPTPQNDSAVFPEDTAVSIPVLANDTDPDNDTLSVVSVGAAASGVVQINPDNTVRYTPNVNFFGSDSFSYQVSDGNNAPVAATVSVTVTPVNDLPLASGDVASTSEDTPVAIAVLANDTDVDGDVLSVAGITQPGNGSAVINGGASVTYTPNPNFTGTDSFLYTLADGNGGTSSASVTVTIAGVNDAPVAANDSATTAEDSAITIPVLSNDSDPEGDTVVLVSVTPATQGQVQLSGTAIVYTPNANFNGQDSFGYSIGDGRGGSATATVVVTVTPVNDAPIAADDSATATEDTPVTISVLGNDSDVDGDALAVTGVTQSAHGSVVIGAGGSVIYTPAANFSGLATFTYAISDGKGGTASATVVVNVIAANDPPVASDDVASTAEDTAVVIGVLGNDTDIDGDALVVASVTVAANGVATISGTAVSYVPNTNFFGTDSFAYTVSDGKGGTDNGVVTVTIAAVNDLPVAVDDNVAVIEDTPLVFNVIANDSDADADVLSVTNIAQPANGTVVQGTAGNVTYTPHANFAGNDSFTYSIADGRGGVSSAIVRITVASVNDLPTAAPDTVTVTEDTPANIEVLVNDLDIDGDVLSLSAVTAPAHGSAQINGNAVQYIPAPNFNGADAFNYSISDGKGGSATAQVSITVNAVNDVPVAVNDNIATTENSPVTIAVLVNDSDVDGDALSVASVTQGSNGSVTINGGASVTYTPNTNFAGSDSFSYAISDGKGGTATATVAVAVGGVNDNPVAVDDTATTSEDQAINVAVLVNDSDVDGDSLRINQVTQGAHGGVAANLDNTVTYTPNPNFNGVDTFSYTIEDGHGGTAVGNVTVTVSPVNDAPVAVNDNTSTSEEVAVTISVLSNDTDVDGDALVLASVNVAPLHGTAVISGNSIVYTPSANFTGRDTLSYTIGDGQGASASATVVIDIVAVNDAPVARNDVASTNEDTPVTANVLANDSDADGDALTILSVTQPAHGNTALINGGTAISYVPSANFHGTDSVTYLIGDGNGGTASATVSVTVVSVNDVPDAVNDSSTTNEDTAVTLQVLTNDSDVDGDTLSVVTVGVPVHGSAVINADHSITYTPAAGFAGSDVFSYTVSDGAGGADSASVTVVVGAVNDAPVAQGDLATGDEDTAISIDVLANDTDADGDSLSVVSVTQPAHGTAVIAGGARVIYTPASNFAGLDSFEYSISDGNGATAFAVVTVRVNPVNDLPVADAGVDFSIQIGRLAALNGSGSFDADGDLLTFAWKVVGVPVGSSVDASALNGANTPSPTFIADVVGDYVFELSISDGQATSADIVTITAQRAPNVGPNANAGLDQNVVTGRVTTLDGSQSNDPDAGPQPLRFTWFFASLPPGSRLTDANIANAGQAVAQFTPDVDGEYLLVLEVSDGNALAQDEVRITATAPPNVAPNAAAGADQSVSFGATVQLDGTASVDPDAGPQPLTFLWTFAAVPSGSVLTNAAISGASTARASFIPDIPGTYLMRLDVGDGAASDFDQVVIEVQPVGLPPIAPVGLVARAKLLHINLDWAPSENATHYRIFRRLNGAADFSEIAAVSSSAAVDDLPPGTTSATYAVKAVNSFGESPLSAPVTVVPTVRAR